MSIRYIWAGLEEGITSNKIYYIEVFRTTIKLKKNFFEGGENNAYKIFMTWVRGEKHLYK